MNKPIILITGANRGIGFELCRLLGFENYYKIILSSRQKQEGILQTQHLVKLGLDVHYLELDISNHASIQKGVSEIIENYGKIDILVNNAGIYVDSSDLDEFPSFLDLTESILNSTFNTNVFGPMILSQLIIPILKDRGLIINISSGGGKINTSGDRSGHIAYRTSKTALNSFTRSFSNYTKKQIINMISVCPGWVRTSMGGQNAPKSVIDGARDIMDIIRGELSLRSGSFYYNMIEQDL